ncbi:alpha/beta fold hydrolase [Desulfosediminicola flagellatus]|uniref:alpha/beta fold hydrolase n=1 Tax=Desulfosediminicola flagellatus TaxID=2569541 RepID=UPI0010AC59D1|nr:alpha/beta hydrolase [Desulfosediminicola flagellatus]
MPLLELGNKHQVHYQLIPGQQNKPYLVFLHEGLGSVALWKDFPASLCTATGHPGLVYDRLGHGKSSSLEHKRSIRYMHECALQELPLLLKMLIPEKDYILIGHSDGGSISLIYGAEHPARLKGIITEAAHVFVEQETLAGIHDAVAAWDKGQLAGLHKYHGSKTVTLFNAWAETWLAEWFRNWSIDELLPRLQVPLLVLQGADDQYGTKKQVNTIVSSASGEAWGEMVPNCGHTPHLEAQPFVLDRMAQFIRQITG